MQFVLWNKEPKDKPVVDAVAPDNKRKLKFSEAIEIFESKKGELQQNQIYNLRGYIKALKLCLKPGDDLCALTFGDVAVFVKKNTTSYDKIRQGLAAMIRFCLLSVLKTEGAQASVGSNPTAS